jgi:hypothetical protein
LPSLSPDARVRRIENPGADVGDQHVVMSIDKGVYVGLDSVGRAIWTRIEGPVTVGALCADLAKAYAAEPGALEADVTAFLETMLAQGMIEVVA